MAARQQAKNSSQLRITVGGPGADIGGFHNLAVQAAIDRVVNLGGGIVEMTDGEFHIKDVIRLRSNVMLRGEREKTILKKCDSSRSSLVEDADANEARVTVEDAAGFEVGMGVTVADSRYGPPQSLRTIISKDGNTLGLNKPLETSYFCKLGGFVQSVFPVVNAVDIQNVRVENLSVDGNRAHNPKIGVTYPEQSWRGIQFRKVKGGAIVDCTVHDCEGDGIMVGDSDGITVAGCAIHDNSYLGIHISMSRRTVVKHCRIFSNGTGRSNGAGIHLCYNAQEGAYHGNQITGNWRGISLGHKDSSNTFTENVIRLNKHSGVFHRVDTLQTYSNCFTNCVIEDNGNAEEGYGFHISGDANGTVLEGCTIRDTRPAGKKLQRIGLYIGPEIDNIHTRRCTIKDNAEEDIRKPGSLRLTGVNVK